MSSQITSLTNPRIKQVVRLQQQASERRETGCFCIEAMRELTRALAAGYEVVEAFVCPSLLRQPLPVEKNVTHVPEHVLAKISYRDSTEGFIAVLRQQQPNWSQASKSAEPGLFIVCSGVEKPGNLGAILRSADAAGCHGLLIDSLQYDLYNPNCIRASTGAIFHLPTLLNTAEAHARNLKQQQVRIIAATPDASESYTAVDYRQPTAFVLGAEAEGLGAFWLDAADQQVRIPQFGSVDSLNVSVTAAVLLFEAARQRCTR